MPERINRYARMYQTHMEESIKQICQNVSTDMPEYY